MIFEERLAALGVDPAIISLHEDRCDALYERFYKASEAIAQELGIGFSALTMITLLLREIAGRDDIIDRLETRLDNVIGERDYLVEKLSEAIGDCNICVYSDLNEAEMPCYQCNFPKRSFEFAGVPEDWMVHDDA